MIIQYLVRTSDKGTIAKPTGSLLIDCYVDADFASLYGKDPHASKSSAKSRLGYVITLGGVPLIWKSQLIQEICLSTTFAKYNSLSQALRAILPIRSLILELVEPLCLPPEIQAMIHARVFEDNNGAYLLAMTHRLTGRTRYFHVKYHHFWDAHDQGLLDPSDPDQVPAWRLHDKRNGTRTFRAQPFIGAVVVKQPSLMNDQ
jgi:hypothetical protein